MLFHLTEHCSLGCPHCMINSTENNKHATEETVKKFIDFALDMKTIKIGIAGGEPTEHPDFFNMFKLIGKKFSRQAIIMLMTNGMWLIDDKFSRKLADLQTEFRFGIQVSSLEGIYPKRNIVVESFHKQKSKFHFIEIIENITVLEDLGRARGKDWLHLGKLYQRKAPNCFNLFSISSSVNSLKEVIYFLEYRNIETNPFGNFCKPLISWDGTIYAGETPSCIEIGSVYDYSDSFRILKTGKPCEKCGVKIPDEINIWK